MAQLAGMLHGMTSAKKTLRLESERGFNITRLENDSCLCGKTDVISPGVYLDKHLCMLSFASLL